MFIIKQTDSRLGQRPCAQTHILGDTRALKAWAENSAELGLVPAHRRGGFKIILCLHNNYVATDSHRHSVSAITADIVVPHIFFRIDDNRIVS
jgi:hypothetical protein